MDIPDNPPDIESAYARYRSLLLMIAWRRFGLSRADAEELVHDVFISLILRWDSVRNVRQWLIGATCNACRTRGRKQARLDQLDPALHDAPSLPDFTDRPVVQQIVQRLRPRDQTILHLRFASGLTAPELGRLLGCSTNAADRRLRRALQHASERGQAFVLPSRRGQAFVFRSARRKKKG
jgi:RNA polymerase sigma factor (sigma-70 family)